MHLDLNHSDMLNNQDLHNIHPVQTGPHKGTQKYIPIEETEFHMLKSDRGRKDGAPEQPVPGPFPLNTKRTYVSRGPKGGFIRDFRERQVSIPRERWTCIGFVTAHGVRGRLLVKSLGFPREKLELWTLNCGSGTLSKIPDQSPGKAFHEPILSRLVNLGSVVR